MRRCVVALVVTIGAALTLAAPSFSKGVSQMRRRALYLGVLGVLGLLLATGALAATGPLVPASGKVAGKGYAYYLKRLQLIAIATDGRIPSCSTVNVGGQKVAMLNPPGGGRTVTCNEPAGRAIYVAVLSNTCSTQQGFHQGFGTSDTDLMKCAKAIPTGVTPSAALDGHPVNLPALLTATGVFSVPKTPGGSTPTPRAAAYGVGLLLSELSNGTHTIQTNVKAPGAPPSAGKSTIEVHVV